jgi:hypothetical protein
MNKLKGSLKSKTMWLSTLLGLLVPALEFLPALKSTLADNYGICLFALSMTIGILRQVTTKSVEDKCSESEKS